MISSVFVNIETLSCPGETVWIISVPMEKAVDTVLLLSGLLYRKVNRIRFVDKSHCVVLSVGTQGYVLNLNEETLAVTEIWLSTVLAMLLDVYLNGWSLTAHVDQDFEKISVTVAVLPPER